MATLTQADLTQFAEHGFLVARELLDLQHDLRPVEEEYAALLDSLAARWHAEGILSSTYSDLPFGQRLTKIIATSVHEYYQHIDIALPMNGIAPNTPMHHGPAIFNLLRSPRLLAAIECLIGPEIYSNPVQHVRIKPPERLVPEALRNSLVISTPWHQDQGVVTEDADNTDMLTVWIAMTAATLENGCMQVIPVSHGELALHCHTQDEKGGLAIPAHMRSPDQVALPMQPGDVLFMHKRMMHASLPNVSDDIRWSFDLRYQPIGQPTGRTEFPGFVAQSRAHPESELWDATEWDRLWLETRARLAQNQDVVLSRWPEDDPRCA